jgi:hypothetical protein
MEEARLDKAKPLSGVAKFSKRSEAPSPESLARIQLLRRAVKEKIAPFRCESGGMSVRIVGGFRKQILPGWSHHAE